MAVQSADNHFTTREQAIAELEAAGLHWLEADLIATAPDTVPHAHDYDTHVYVQDGAIELHEPDTGLVHRVERGGRITIPAGVRHCGVHGGYRGVLGLSVDPASIAPAAVVRERLGAG